MALLLADGQLSSASATILGTANNERTVAVVFYNTDLRDQTIILTLTRSGSTARTIRRAVLATKETLDIVGIPMDPSDVLAGYATNASVVDYVVMNSTAQFSSYVREATGAAKSSASLEVTIPAKSDIDEGTLEVIGLLQEVRDVLLKIA